MDNITRAIHDELVLSYTQSARVVPTTVAVVAASLRDALGFADEEEVHKTFTKARDMADVPTQRVLKEALNNFRAEHRAYLQIPSDAPRLTHPGSKIVTAEERKYIMALCGYGMSREAADAYIKEFEADPRNKEMVDYHHGRFNVPPTEWEWI